MAPSDSDKKDVRDIVVEALEIDIKEIHLTQSRLEKRLMGGDKFAKLTLEKNYSN